MAVFNGTGGADSLIGTDAEGDIFRFTPLTLSAADTVRGGEGTDIIDVLQFTAGGTVAAAALANVLGIERVQLAAGGNAIALTEALVGSALGDVLELRGGAGADSIDGGALGSAFRLRVLTGTSSSDTVLGGAGADTLLAQGAGSLNASLGAGNDLFQTDPGLLDAADTIAGGAGIDRVQFLSAGAIGAAALARLSGFEEIQLAAGLTELTFSTAALLENGGLLTIIGNNDAARIDAGAVAAGRLLYQAGGGADTFIGGGGNDTVEAAGALSGSLGGGRDLLRLASAAAAGGAVDAGAGFDTLELLGRGAHNLAAYTGFERISMAQAGSVLLPGTPGLDLDASDGNDAVTIGGAGQGVFGNGGNDTVVLPHAFARGAVLDGGEHTVRDTLVLLGFGTDWNLLSSTLVTGFERILYRLAEDDAVGLAIIRLGFQAAELRLQNLAEVFMRDVAGQKVIGSADADTIHGGGAGQVLMGGHGNDFMTADLAHLRAGTIVAGGAGRDLLLVDGGGEVDITEELAVVGVETIGFNQALRLTSRADDQGVQGSGEADIMLAGGARARLDGSIGADSLIGFGADSTLIGGIGADTLEARGPGFEMVGAEGNDLYLVGTFEQTFWATPGMRIGEAAGSGAGNIDTLRIYGGSMPLDFTLHEVSQIDRIESSAIGRVTLTLSAEMAQTANANGDASAGDIEVQALTSSTGALHVDAMRLTAGQVLRLTGSEAADSVLGGAGGDTLFGSFGADTLDGGLGADRLTGEAGDDRLVGGNGGDTFLGGAGADRIDLTEAVAAGDSVEFNRPGDGSPDINDATSVTEAMADLVQGFGAGDAISLVTVAIMQLGLGSGGVQVVGSNAAWNVGAAAVFIFDPLDTLAGNNFAELTQLAGGLSTDMGTASGSSPNRTVALLIENQETNANRTGLYHWTDIDGDAVLEAGDVVRLLAVFEGVSTSQLSASNVLLV